MERIDTTNGSPELGFSYLAFDRQVRCQLIGPFLYVVNLLLEQEQNCLNIVE